MCKSNLRYDGQLLKRNALKTLFKRWLSLCSTMGSHHGLRRLGLFAYSPRKKLAVLDANRVNMAYIVWNSFLSCFKVRRYRKPLALVLIVVRRVFFSLKGQLSNASMKLSHVKMSKSRCIIPLQIALVNCRKAASEFKKMVLKFEVAWKISYLVKTPVPQNAGFKFHQ